MYGHDFRKRYNENTSNDRLRGAKILDAMMLIGDAMPKEQQERFNSMIKYYVGIDEAYYYSQSSHIASLMKANQIMNDGSIEPRSEYVLHKLFASMDKLVHIRPDYGFALSMHSDRTYGHELINDEGKRTWNISDGMTYLYNGDQDQYGTGYWATVDPKRLAGTTTEYVTRPDGAGDRRQEYLQLGWRLQPGRLRNGQMRSENTGKQWKHKKRYGNCEKVLVPV